jgi:tRNA(fMet)-specific endonuclease VapC
VRYLLDTDLCIDYLRGSDPMVRDWLLACSPADVCLCSVVKAELLFGAHNSQKVAANLRRLNEFFEPFQSLPFDDGAAEVYGSLRSHIRREGQEIGSNDLMIAATAVALGLTLVTRNRSEFDRVPGLRVTQWKAD